MGFILIMLGFLFQWPTLLTIGMFPILLWMYVRLAGLKEREARTEFGDAYGRYAAHVAGFVPRLSRSLESPIWNGGKRGNEFQMLQWTT